MAIKPSPRLALLLLLFHVMVSIIVYATMMPLAARLAMLMPILLSLFYYLARDALLLFPDSWREISFENHPHPNLLPEGEGTIASSPASGRGLRGGLGSVSAVTRDGSGFFGQVASRTTVSPYFIVLRVRPKGRRLPVFRTIFPDTLDMGEFRELSVRLRFSQVP
ncbi:MAG TPA: hypothetical protein VFQ98_03520 [Gallionella sp.]|nr:hypothetical protein [Gallionella sp.]